MPSERYSTNARGRCRKPRSFQTLIVPWMCPRVHGDLNLLFHISAMIHFQELKKFFLFASIGALVLAALVAVGTVLFGQFNEITARVFLTLFMVVVHSLGGLAFIWDDSRRNTFETLSFFVNTVFLIIVMSFFVSIFSIWKILGVETVFHSYQTFFYFGFASLHANILFKAYGKEKYMDAIIYANYVCIVLVLLMLLPIIYIHDAAAVLGGMYFRILAAISIVDGTLSILTIIFYKLFMHKHPEMENVLLNSVTPKSGRTFRGSVMSWVMILFVYLLFHVVYMIHAALTGFSHMSSSWVR